MCAAPIGFEREEIEDALLRTNTERCSPPLPEVEVRQVAASVSRYEPGKGTPPPDPATVAALDTIEADLLTTPWPKVGGKSERSAAVARRAPPTRWTGRGFSLPPRSGIGRIYESEDHRRDTKALRVALTRTPRLGDELGNYHPHEPLGGRERKEFPLDHVRG